jgi:hypothetical protein
MKQKFYLFSLYLIFVFFIFLTIYSIAQDVSHNFSNIFLLDTSLSMDKNKARSFERVKNFINKKIATSNINDQIIIITFDEIAEQVINRTIKNEFDKNKISKQVNLLQLKGQWTWIRKAFEQLKKTIQSIELEYPAYKINLYFLTDGEDDPPPNSNETSIPVMSLIDRYFDGYEMVDSCVYFLSYNPVLMNKYETEKISVKPELENETDTIKRKSELKSSRINTELEQTPQKSDSKFETDTIKRKSELKSSRINTELEQTPQKSDSKLETDSIVFKSELKSLLMKSEQELYKDKFKSEQEVDSVRSKFESKLSLKETEPEQLSKKHESKQETFQIRAVSIPKPSLVKRILLSNFFEQRNVNLFFIILISVFILIIISKLTMFKSMTVWVEGESNNRVVPVKINAWRKSTLKEFNLPNYYLIMDRFRKIIYLGETINKKIYFLKNRQKVSCVLPSGKRRYLIFHFLPLGQKSNIRQF